METHSVIRSPVVTEKSTSLTEKGNRYSFLIDPRATKLEVKKAVEKIFNVKVLKVNSLRMPGKKRKVRYRMGKTPDRRKAIVTLRKEDKIELA